MKLIRAWIREHSLSVALAVVLAAQMVFYWFSGLVDWRIEHPHGKIFPTYLWHYLAEITVSVLADTYGALLLVLFAKWFFERGFPESE